MVAVEASGLIVVEAAVRLLCPEVGVETDVRGIWERKG